LKLAWDTTMITIIDCVKSMNIMKHPTILLEKYYLEVRSCGCRQTIDKGEGIGSMGHPKHERWALWRGA